MTLDHRTDLLDSEDEPARLSRRKLLRRSACGLTGVALASLLAACGGGEDDEDGDEAENAEDDGDDGTEGPSGLEEIDEAPAGEDPEPGGGGDDGAGGEGD